MYWLTARAGLLRGGTSDDPHTRSNGRKGMRGIPRGPLIPETAFYFTENRAMAG